MADQEEQYYDVSLLGDWDDGGSCAQNNSYAFHTLVRAVGMSFASLSILGALAIILTYIKWKDMRTTSRLLLVYISIADLFTALGNLLGQAFDLDRPVVKWNTTGQAVLDYHPPWCVAQSFVTTTSSLSSFFWTSLLAWYLMESIVHTRGERYQQLLYKLAAHFIGWGVPLTLGVVALGRSALGADQSVSSSAGWCFVRGVSDADGFSLTDKTVWQLMVGKAWEILTYVIMVGLYVRIKCFIKTNDRHQTFVTHGSVQAIREVDRKFTFVPMLFILIRLWGTIRFFIGATHHCEPLTTVMKVFLILQSMGDSSQGLANFILFVAMTKKVRRRLRRCACCDECRSSGELSEKTSIIEYHTASSEAQQRGSARGKTKRSSIASRSSSASARRIQNAPPKAEILAHTRGQNSSSPSTAVPRDFFTVGGGVFVDPEQRDSDVSSNEEGPWTDISIQT